MPKPISSSFGPVTLRQTTELRDAVVRDLGAIMRPWNNGTFGRVDNLTSMASDSSPSDLRLVLRTVTDVHSQLRDFVLRSGAARTDHGIWLRPYSDDHLVEVVACAGAYSEDGNTDVLYSVQVRPGDDVVTIVGEVELTGPDGNTRSVFQETATATQPEQIADQIRSMASRVLDQRQWLESSDSG
jgi:hypothetical protein